MAEEFTRGCYGAHFARRSLDVLRRGVARTGRTRPLGRHRVGWKGYTEGTVRSSEAAVDAVGALDI